MVIGLLGVVATGALVITQSIAAWSLVTVCLGMTGLYLGREAVASSRANVVREAREQFLLERPGDVPKQLPKRSLAGEE